MSRGRSALTAYVILLFVLVPWGRELSEFFSEILGRRNLGHAVDTLVLASGVAALIWLRRRRPLLFHGRALAAIVGVVAATGGVLAVLGPEERIHLVEYGLLGLLASRQVEPLPVLGLLAAVSVADESLQSLLPSRVGDLRDVAVNMGSGLLGLCLERLVREGP